MCDKIMRLQLNLVCASIHFLVGNKMYERTRTRHRQPAGPHLLIAVLGVAVGSLLFSSCRKAGNDDLRLADTSSSTLIDDRTVIDWTQLGDAVRSQNPVFQTDDANQLEEHWHQVDNPLTDGWATEAFAADAGKQFNKIGKLLEHPDKLADARLDELATTEFRSDDLLPSELESVFRDKQFHIQRKTPSDEQPTSLFSGVEGLRQTLIRLGTPYIDAKNIRTKFKIFRVHVDDKYTTTRQLVEMSGEFEDGILEHHATWNSTWVRSENKAPRLASLDLIELEQIRVRTPTGTLFSDCTRSVLENNPSYEEQFLQGYGHWMLRKLYTRYQITEMMGHPGLAIGDVNGDGLADLYVCQEQGLPNRLFLQNVDGTADDVSAKWNVDWLQACRSPLLVDLDNDGDQDLVVSFLGGVLVASNEANASFQIRTVLSTGDDMMSLAASDYDQDGDLDLYATAYYADKILGKQQVAGLPGADSQFVYHDANVGGTNTLLRNDLTTETWTFHDVTEEVGLNSNNSRYTLAAAWEDFDNDGDQDLYVANDYGRDNLYRNDGGKFVDIAAEAGAEDAASGMSISWSDFDHDGWMDAYISNMWSSAGNRITYQPHFKQNASPEVKRRLQRFARGNTLLRNDGQQHFQSVSKDAGVEMGRWAWGSLFADINNDGWDDLLIANGFITKNDNSGDL